MTLDDFTDDDIHDEIVYQSTSRDITRANDITRVIVTHSVRSSLFTRRLPKATLRAAIRARGTGVNIFMLRDDFARTVIYFILSYKIGVSERFFSPVLELKQIFTDETIFRLEQKEERANKLKITMT